MFFQLFLGGITLKMIPSENGSRLSTSSSSALPPSVIICRLLQLWVRWTEPSTHLVHLLQLQRDQVEPSHELIQTRLPQAVVRSFLRITLASCFLQVLLPILVLCLSLFILPENAQIRLCVLDFLCRCQQ